MSNNTTWINLTLAAALGLALLMTTGCPAPQDEAPPAGTQSVTTTSPVKTADAGDQQPTTETVLAVSGMTCGSCEKAIKGEVGKLAGISEVSADHAAGIVTVSYTPSAEAIGDISAAIERLGFTVEGENGVAAAPPEAAPAAENSEEEAPADAADQADEPVEDEAPAAEAGCGDCEGGECSGECVEVETEAAEPPASGEGETAAEDGEAGEESGCGGEGGCAACDKTATGAAPETPPAGFERVTLSIEGMTCAGKAGWVGRTVGEMEGVAGCYTDAASGTAVIDFDPASWDAKGLIALIEEQSEGIFKPTQI